MRKPMKVSRRAAIFAEKKIALGTHSVGDTGPLEDGWTAGYRAAMRDARKLWMRERMHVDESIAALDDFFNDTERLK